MIPDRVAPLLNELKPLVDLFSANGKRVYLVGGVVRDLLAGKDLSTADVDLTTDAVPSEIKMIVAPWADSVWTQGERFGTIGLMKDERPIEITTHRSERYEANSRNPEVSFSTDIAQDLSRRDFTVNAMALELTTDTPQLVDPFDGALDLVDGRLRTPVSPQQSFDDDPLRMLRAARFIAGYGLVPDPALVEAVRVMASRLEIISVERIRDELNKLMVVEDPSNGLWFVHDTGLADYFFPELPSMRVEQDPIHRHKDVLTHTIAVVANTSPSLVVRLAALFHDVGKPATKAIGSKGVSFHQHEVVGARMTRERMKALKYPKDITKEVSQLVYLHLRFHTFSMGWTDAAVRRFVRDAGTQLAELIELTRCDCTTRNKRRAAELASRIDLLEQRIEELRAEEALAAIRPDLDGNDVMAHLGIGPSRVVGDAVRYLLELRIERGPMMRDDALNELDAWWSTQQAATGNGLSQP